MTRRTSPEVFVSYSTDWIDRTCCWLKTGPDLAVDRVLVRSWPALYKKSVIPGYASLYLRRAVVLCALLVGQLVLYGLTWVIGDAAISMMELILELARVQLILYT